MNDKQTEAIIDEIYDESREDTLLSMVGQLYSRRMWPSGGWRSGAESRNWMPRSEQQPPNRPEAYVTRAPCP